MSKPIYRTMSPDLVKPLREFKAADIEHRRYKLAQAVLTNYMRQRVRAESPSFAGNQYPVPTTELPNGVYGRIKLSYVSLSLDYDRLKELDPDLYRKSLCLEEKGAVYYTAEVEGMPCDDQVDLLPTVMQWESGLSASASWADLLRWYTSLSALETRARNERAGCRKTLDLIVIRTNQNVNMHSHLGYLTMTRQGCKLVRERRHKRRMPRELYDQVWRDRPELMWQVQRGIVQHPIEWSWPFTWEQISAVFTNIDCPDPLTPHLIIGP